MRARPTLLDRPTLGWPAGWGPLGIAAVGVGAVGRRIRLLTAAELAEESSVVVACGPVWTPESCVFLTNTMTILAVKVAQIIECGNTVDNGDVSWMFQSYYWGFEWIAGRN